MVPDNSTIVSTHLDWLRVKQPKFICLNDDMKGEAENKTVELSGLKEMKMSQKQQRSRLAVPPVPVPAEPPAPSAVELLHRFYTSYLPTPCSFELPNDVMNDYLYVDSYFQHGIIPAALRFNYDKWKQLHSIESTVATISWFNQWSLKLQQQPARATTIIAIVLLMIGFSLFYCLSVWFGRPSIHRFQLSSVLSSNHSSSSRGTIRSTTTSRFAKREKAEIQV